MIALLIDIGNSRIKWRMLHLGAAPVHASPPWASTEQAISVAAIHELGPALCAGFPGSLDQSTVDIVFVSNVASDAIGCAVEETADALWPGASIRRVRSSEFRCGLVNGYRDPNRLGSDRWLAGIAAHGLYRDRSILVCSFGTATTIDLIEVDPARPQTGTFVGGLILPGITAMYAVLSSSTARLPRTAGRLVAFGDTTEDSITTGVLAGQIGAVAWGLARMRDRAKSEAEAAPTHCVVAGGGAEAMAPLIGALDTTHDLVHDLVLRGLANVANETASSDPTNRTN